MSFLSFMTVTLSQTHCRIYVHITKRIIPLLGLYLQLQQKTRKLYAYGFMVLSQQ